MKLHWLALLTALSDLPAPASSCPFAKNTGGATLPDDEIHRRSLRRRLSDTPEVKDKVKAIIDNRTNEQKRQHKEAQRSLPGAGGDDARSSRSLTTNEGDPTQPFSHVADDDLLNQIIVSYASLEALSQIQAHVAQVNADPTLPDINLKGSKNFSRVQKKKNRQRDDGRRRSLQDDEEENAGFAIIVTKEDLSEYTNITGVTGAEFDTELTIDGVSFGANQDDVVKKYVDDTDLADARRLQEERPWGIDIVNVTDLWDIPPPIGSDPITICVVDTGYDLGHVDLPQLPLQNVTGWDTGNPNNGVWDVDGHSHGTHCAGSIGAIGNNDEGVVGVWNDKVERFRFHIAKGLSNSGSGAGSDVLNAVSSCVEAGARVISMSLGCDNCFSPTTDLFYQDVYDQNVLIIAAAGNSGDVRDHFPSGYPAVMSVASVAEGGGVGSANYGTLSGFSTRNDQTEIAGPGSSVRSTVPGDNYATFSGTSMATPHVAGVAALLWSHFPDCTNNQIRNAMLHSVREPPTTDPQNTPGWDIFYGYGTVNAGAAYELLSSRGCVGAGGAFPDVAAGETLSDMAPGGGEQLQFGCTLDEHCSEGASNPCVGESTCDLSTNTCVEGTPAIDCSDGFACTIDTCDPTRAPGDLCVNTPIVCDDGDVCNGIFSCDESTGGCVEDTAAVICELETECNLASCDALTGVCTYTPRVCDDSNPCTSNDTCDDSTGCVFQEPDALCCGNGVCEADATVPEDETSCAVDCNPDAPVGGSPTWKELSPWPDDIISGATIELMAKVFDDDIQRVSFRVQSPDGTRTNFSPGTLVSTTGDLTTWTFQVDTSSQKGSYGYRIEMRDQSGNTVQYPETSLAVEGGSGGGGGGGGAEIFIEFLVAETTADIVDAARADIASLINNHPTNLAAKFVRMAFHDCVGGCDGCIDLTNGDNFGLEEPIDALTPIVDKFAHFGMTRADLWALASLEGARGAQGNGDDLPFPLVWFGRPNCEDTNDETVEANCVENDCSAKRGPHRDLPSPHLSTHEMLDFFNATFGFAEPWQTVAIMGAHTLGTLSRENSGFNGPNGWLGNTNRLDNGYYNNLVGGTLTDFTNGNFEALMNAAQWQQVFYNNSAFGTPDRWEWERGTNPHFVMLNGDIALVRDLSDHIEGEDGQVSQCQFQCNRNGGSGCPLPRCPHAADTLDVAAEYKHDNTKFLEDFQSAFTKMLEAGSDISEGCSLPPCPLPGTFTNSPSTSPTTPVPSTSPTLPQPSSSPTPKPTRTPAIAIVTELEYDAIDADIAALSAAFGNDNVSRAHFLGGIVRLVAHDFMDFDISNEGNPMGSDGCIDMEHPDNSGLPQDVWCEGCPLTEIYINNFFHLSKADFWIASANAVIRIASNNELDMKSDYVSGRRDANECIDQGTRLPAATGCDAVEGVFVDRLGLTRTDAVALLGAHTIGRGDQDFSGHHGIWVDTEAQSVVWDKRYYEEIFRRAWIPRNQDNQALQDWTWGGNNGDSPRFMLNTDMCLFFDIEATFPCCTLTQNGGNNACDRNGLVLRNTQCATYPAGSPRAESASAVELFAGLRAGGGFDNDNTPFFNAFAIAWGKATTNGLSGLQPIVPSPTPSPVSSTTGSPTLPQPSASPTLPQPSVSPTLPQPSVSPTTRSPVSAIVSEQEYDAIDADIAALSAAFGNDNISRAHFLGGIVRLVAHDFMDFDISNEGNPMGSDGCIDMEHPDNSGLPQDVWCEGCPLTEIYINNFFHLSKADFWIASANAVIRIASNNELNLKTGYASGRIDADTCIDQGTRLPAATGCDAVEGVFVDRLGLTRTDAVALLGAHTIGRGDQDFSGHHGIWVDTEAQSVVWDKRYYEEIFRRAWIPRNQDNQALQDWTWGGNNGDSPRFMLNTDMCLFFDIEATFPCCTLTQNGGNNACDRNGLVLRNTQCATYPAGSPRAESASAVELFAGLRAGGGFDNDNTPFFNAFAIAWGKATTNGLSDLVGLDGIAINGVSISPTSSPIAQSSPQTSGPTPALTPNSTNPETSEPTPALTPNPTHPPSISSGCEDEASFRHNGRDRDCAWVIAGDRCKNFANKCPVSCNACAVL